jgi:hypothetical protein
MDFECPIPFGPGLIVNGLLRKFATEDTIGGYILLNSTARSDERASLLATTSICGNRSSNEGYHMSFAI